MSPLLRRGPDARAVGLLGSTLRAVVAVVALSGAAPALAGEALSIEDALRRSLGVSEDVTVSEAGVDRAAGQQMSARSGYLPSVNGSVGYTRTFLTEFEQIFARAAEDAAAAAAAAGTTPTGTPTTGTPSGTGTTTGTGGSSGSNPLSSLPFGQDNAWRVDVSVNQPIWSGFRAVGQSQLARASRESADLALRSSRASAALGTAQAYYDAALADRLLQIAQATLAQAEQTAAHAQLAHEVGRQPEYELLRAQVEVENQRVNVIRQTRAREAARLRLAQLLELPSGRDLTLTTPLGDEQPTDVSSVATEVAGVGASAERLVVAQTEAAVAISEASLKITRSQGLPSLSANLGLAFTSYPQTVPPSLDMQDWYTTLTAGVRLDVPIFNGLRVRGDLLTAQASVRESRARLEQVQELAELDAQDTDLQLQAASAAWTASSGTVAQAQRAYQIAEVRYQEGISTQTELADARLLLESTLANRAQSARDLQVARIRAALLPALPLQGAAPTSATY